MSRIDDKETLLDLERTRASALVGGDIDTLRSFIPEDLMHVHATGAIDNYDAYFNLLENDLKFRRIERGKLRIDISGETAVMTGPQQIEFEWVRTGVAKTLDAHVIQIWRKREGRWQQIIFQATAATST